MHTKSRDVDDAALYSDPGELKFVCGVVLVAWIELILMAALLIGHWFTKFAWVADAFALVIVSLVATAIIYVPLALKIRCPHCTRRFLIEDFSGKNVNPGKYLGLACWANTVADVLRKSRFSCMYCGRRYRLK